MTGTWAELQWALPAIVSGVAAVVVLMVEAFGLKRHASLGWLTVVALAAVACSACLAGADGGGVFAAALSLDSLTCYFTVVIAVLAALSVLLAIDYLPTTDIAHGEFYPLVLFAVCGLIVLASATDLVVMFLGLETMSMAVYVLAGIWRSRAESAEGGLKYFLMGAFASAFMLYGIALIWAAAGSTSLAVIAEKLVDGATAPFIVGAGMLLVGFGFKIAAVPFHQWAPDAYEGAPTSVTAFMSTAVKAGAFAATIRVVSIALGGLRVDLSMPLWLVAAATMTVGNVAALRQTSIKRMLAYSSIAHTGYMLVGVVAGTPDAWSALLYYIAVYGVMNLGAFAVVISLGRNDRPCDDIDDLAGAGARYPILGVCLTVCMLSLLGIPPLAGFIGKFSLFSAALDAGQTGLVLIAIVNSVVSAVYYLGVVRAMYFETAREEDTPPVRGHATAVVALSVLAIVGLGLSPNPLMNAAESAVAQVRLGPDAEMARLGPDAEMVRLGPDVETARLGSDLVTVETETVAVVSESR